jgi:hypothetical protein
VCMEPLKVESKPLNVSLNIWRRGVELAASSPSNAISTRHASSFMNCCADQQGNSKRAPLSANGPLEDLKALTFCSRVGRIPPAL